MSDQISKELHNLYSKLTNPDERKKDEIKKQRKKQVEDAKNEYGL